MKKMKGGGKREILDDAGGKFKHKSLHLLHDYQELEKETEVTRNMLQRANDKKLTLEAEVSFLRRRYYLLLKSRAQSHQTKHDITLPRKLKAPAKKTSKAKNSTTKGVATRQPVPKFESSQKRKVHNKMQNLSLSLDLNQNITRYSMEESASRNLVHKLDLNQEANAEDDFQLSIEPLRTGASAYVKGLNDEQVNDMKLSACRNIGNAVSSRAGKRKISWQDPVALRV